MNNAFKLTTLFYSLFFIPFFITAQQTTTDTGAHGTFTNFDRFNSFYMHPMGSHFSGRMLHTDVSMVYSSNAAINSMAYDFYLKKPLNGNDVNTMVGKFTEINIGGRENNYGVGFVAPLKKYNHFFTVGYNYRRHQSTRFSGEFGKFFFKGNKEFAGKEIYGDEMHYLSTRYDALKAGWLHYFNIKGKRAIIALDAGFARGFEHRSFNVKKGRLFTEENGEYIEASLNMKARRSSYVPLRPFEYSGLGAIANAEFSMMLTDKSGFSVKVSDIGFLSWDKKSLTYDRGDTTIRFEGVIVPNIDSMGSSNYTRQLGDSIINLFKVPYQSGGFTTMLPTRFMVTFYMTITDNSYLNVHLQEMAFATFRPQLRVESVNFIGQRWYSTTGISLGGFGPLDIYQTVGWQVNKTFFATLGLYGIEGMLAPSQAAGFGGNAGLSARF